MTEWKIYIWIPVAYDSVNGISDEHTDPHHEEKTIAQVFEETFMKLGTSKFMGKEQTMFKCKKCGENIEEFLLYAHIESHKNPETQFGKEAWDSLPEGIGKELMRERFSEWEEGEE